MLNMIVDNCRTQDHIIRTTPTLRYAIFNAWWPRFDGEGRVLNHFDSDIRSAPAAEQYKADLHARLNMLESRGIKVFVFGPKPEINYDITYCFDRPLKAPSRSCRVRADVREAQQEHLLKILHEVLAQHPKVAFFDQNKVLCGKGDCTLISDDGLPMLRDNGHYSRHGSERAIKAFVEDIQKAGYFTAAETPR